MASNLQHAKTLLRKSLKMKLKQLSVDEREKESQIAIRHLVESSYFKNSQRISVYLPMSDEINTLPLVRCIFECEKTCFIPKYVGDSMEMVRLHSYNEIKELPLTPWNIRQPADDEDEHREPKRENALETGGLDLIVVPGLGFTLDGSRIGRGKGFYDSFIQRCVEGEGREPDLIMGEGRTPDLVEGQGRKPLLVALAFRHQICEDIPTNELDRKVDCVIYPEM